MNLSWFNGEEGSDPSDLIESETSISATYGTATYDSYDIWVTNNGNEDGTGNLIDFGFYIDCDDPNELASILRLANDLDGDDKPCGLFVVFGYGNNLGEDSYIDNFESLSYSDLLKFQVNWTQGSSVLNKIDLKSAYTYNGISYVLRNNLYTNAGSMNMNGETKGILKIRVVLKTASGSDIFLSNVRLNAYCIKET